MSTTWPRPRVLWVWGRKGGKNDRMYRLSQSISLEMSAKGDSDQGEISWKFLDDVICRRDIECRQPGNDKVYFCGDCDPSKHCDVCKVALIPEQKRISKCSGCGKRWIFVEISQIKFSKNFLWNLTRHSWHTDCLKEKKKTNTKKLFCTSCDAVNGVLVLPKVETPEVSLHYIYNSNYNCIYNEPKTFPPKINRNRSLRTAITKK